MKEKTIEEHVKELMKNQSKKDLAVMYANLFWCFNQITKQIGITVKNYKREIRKIKQP